MSEQQITVTIRFDIPLPRRHTSFQIGHEDANEQRRLSAFALHQDVAELVFANVTKLAVPHGARIQGVSVMWPEEVEQ